MSNDTTNPAIDVEATIHAQVLAKHQPCGCVLCTCEDEERCHGCGAKNCGTHEVGKFPSFATDANQGSQTMSNNQTEIVDESRAEVPKDPRALVIRYYNRFVGWTCTHYATDKLTQHMYDTVYTDQEKYPVARLIRILPEGEVKP